MIALLAPYHDFIFVVVSEVAAPTPAAVAGVMARIPFWSVGDAAEPTIVRPAVTRFRLKPLLAAAMR
jgi:hypothetical protein